MPKAPLLSCGLVFACAWLLDPRALGCGVVVCADDSKNKGRISLEMQWQWRARASAAKGCVCVCWFVELDEHRCGSPSATRVWTNGFANGQCKVSGATQKRVELNILLPELMLFL